MASLGTKLLNLRHERRFSQTEIADILGISQNAYNKWEADKCMPSAVHLSKISQFYKIDIMKLLDNNEKPIQINNDINGENTVIANTNSTIHIQSSTSLMEQALQIQEQISKLSELQLHLIEELLKKNQ
ncbi:MAG: helix-turn-helix transcriptional regulator [Candidatus Azobacteroides sp.]|nr:helix-turn-helix transcriptional regulator [Candidatus Azobacteroides sp.]